MHDREEWIHAVSPSTRGSSGSRPSASIIRYPTMVATAPATRTIIPWTESNAARPCGRLATSRSTTHGAAAATRAATTVHDWRGFDLLAHREVFAQERRERPQDPAQLAAADPVRNREGDQHPVSGRIGEHDRRSVQRAGQITRHPVIGDQRPEGRSQRFRALLAHDRRARRGACHRPAPLRRGARPLPASTGGGNVDDFGAELEGPRPAPTTRPPRPASRCSVNRTR